MSMAYYHSLGNLRISGLSNKLKNIHDYIDTILQILEWILIWPNSENKESTIMPYIIINTNETNRLYTHSQATIPFNDYIPDLKHYLGQYLQWFFQARKYFEDTKMDIMKNELERK